jgi:hypothetical protein
MSEHGPRESTPHDTFFEPGTRPLKGLERDAAKAIQEILELDRARLGLHRNLSHIGEALRVRIKDAARGGMFDTQTQAITLGPSDLYEHIITLTHEYVHDTSLGTWNSPYKKNNASSPPLSEGGQLGFMPIMPTVSPITLKRRDQSLMRGLNEGVTEHYTRYVLSQYAEVFEKHIPGFDANNFRSYVQHIDTGHNHDYNPLVQVVDDVISQVYEYEYAQTPDHEHLSHTSVRDDVYRAFFGAPTKKEDRKAMIALARRIENACGIGTVHALESMRAPHSELGITSHDAKVSVPDVVRYENGVPVPIRLRQKNMYAQAAHIASQHPDWFSELPGTHVSLERQKRYMMIRFVNPAMKIIQREFPADSEELSFITAAHHAIKTYLIRLSKPDHRYSKQERQVVAHILNDRYRTLDAYIHFMEHRATFYLGAKELAELIVTLPSGGHPEKGPHALANTALRAYENAIAKDEDVYKAHSPRMLRHTKGIIQHARNVFRGKTHTLFRLERN